MTAPTAQRPTVPTPPNPEPLGSRDDVSTGQLVAQLSAQVSHLVRSELALAQVELKQKGKRAGIGAGAFGGAAFLGLYGLTGLLVAGGLALGLVLSAWLSALIVAGVLLLVAGVAALIGKSSLSKAMPPMPKRLKANVSADVAVLKQVKP